MKYPKSQTFVEKVAEETASCEACWDAVYRYLAGHIGLADLDSELQRLKESAEEMLTPPSFRGPDDPESKYVYDFEEHA